MTWLIRITSGMLPLARLPALRALARPCWPKKQHATRGAARAQMRSLLNRGLEKDATLIHVYRCPHCDGWHVGHERAGDGVASAPDGGIR